MAPLWGLVLHTDTHTHTCSHTLSTVLLYLKMHYFVNTFLYDASWFHLWHFTRNKNPLHCLNVNNNKRSTEHATHCLQSAAAGGKGSRRCVYTQTQDPPRRHFQTEMSGAFDSISLVWACSLTDEATLCWWTCRFRYLNAKTSDRHRNCVGEKISSKRRWGGGGGVRL